MFTRQFMKVVFACAPALLAPLSVAQSGPFESEFGGLAAPIEGTWIFTIHRVVTGITFSALQSFTAGGVTLATGTIDRTPVSPSLQPFVSPLYGSWSRKDDNSYVATICFFVFNLDGTPAAMIKTNLTLRLKDENDLVGTGTGFACDINGNNCVNINSPVTITGKRLIAQGA